MPAPKALRDIQALRGLAALVVVGYHMAGLEAVSAWSYRLLQPFDAFGYAGVDLFFVLSGFIILHANAARLGQPAAFLPYLRNRLWRVYPTYWVCFLATTLLFHWILKSCYYPGYFRHAFYHLLLVPLPQANFAIPQAWTLCYEVMFYGLFGSLFLVPRRWAPRLLAGWFLAAAITSFLIQPRHRVWLMPLSAYTLEFLLGVLAAVLLSKTGTKYKSFALSLGAIGGAIGIALNIAGTIQIANDPSLRLLGFGLPAALLVLGLSAREQAGTTTLPRWLRPLGDASYSIYITHIAVLWAYQSCGAYATAWSLTIQWLLIASQLIAACAVGWLTHIAIEKPLLAWNRRAKRTTPGWWLMISARLFGRRITPSPAGSSSRVE